MSDEHYVKVYSRLPRSSVNLEAIHTRWLFVILLSQADRNGIVYGTLESLAALANLSLEQAREAMEVLSSPDARSTSKAEQGRRVLPKPGNRWLLVNHGLYSSCTPGQMREIQARVGARERKRRERALRKERLTETERDHNVTSYQKRSSPSDLQGDNVAVDVPVDVPIERKGGDAPGGSPLSRESRRDHGDPQAVIEAFVEAFKAKHATAPVVIRGKYHKIANQLLEGRSLEDACTIAQAFGSDPPTGLETKGMIGFANILLAADEIVARIADEEHRRQKRAEDERALERQRRKDEEQRAEVEADWAAIKDSPVGLLIGALGAMGAHLLAGRVGSVRQVSIAGETLVLHCAELPLAARKSLREAAEQLSKAARQAGLARNVRVEEEENGPIDEKREQEPQAGLQSPSGKCAPCCPGS